MRILKIYLASALLLLFAGCSQQKEGVAKLSGVPDNHLLPGTKCKIVEVQWLSELEDSKHYRLYYNKENLISKIVNLDSNKREDPDHFSECTYENGKMQQIVYSHFENINGQRLLRKNIRSFEYFENGLVKSINVNTHDTRDELLRCEYLYDNEGDIINRVCKGTIDNLFTKDSTVFQNYSNGRPQKEIQFVSYKDDMGKYGPWRLQNEYKYTYDQNNNLIKKEFRRDTLQSFDVRFTATFDASQINPVAEILHIIDEITLSWHENPNLHTRDMNKNFKTSTRFYITHSEKGPDGKRRDVRLVHTDTLINTLKDSNGRVIQKDYQYTRSDVNNGPRQVLSMKFTYDCIP